MHRSLRLFWSLCVVSQLLPAAIFASSSGGYGGNSLMGFGGASSLGYGGSSGGGAAYGQGSKGPVTAAVETHRTVEVKPVQMNNEPIEPQVIEVPSDDTPVVVHFKSQSSRVLVQQTHTPAQIGEPEHTSSEDEPQKVIHEVLKPVIQEVREVIQPYRRVIQQIQPVMESTHTIIAKGEPRPDVAPLSVSGASTGSLSGSGAGAGGLGGLSGGGKSYGSGGNYAASASTVSLKSAPGSSSESARSSVPSHSMSSSHQSNANTGRKYSQQAIQQIFQQSPSQTYSARRGDLREPQPSQTRMSMRPAPVAYNTYYRQPVVQAMQPMQPSYGYSDYQTLLSALHEEDLPALMTFVAKPARFRARARA